MLLLKRYGTVWGTVNGPEFIPSEALLRLDPGIPAVREIWAAGQFAASIYAKHGAEVTALTPEGHYIRPELRGQRT